MDEKDPLRGQQSSDSNQMQETSLSNSPAAGVHHQPKNPSVVIKSTDGKFHLLSFDQRLNTLEFALLKANQQPTDKFITVPLKSVLALRYTRIKFNAEDGLPTSVDPDILPGQVAPAEEFGKRRQLYMYYSYRSNVYTRRLREAVLCFMGPMDEERNHWFQLVNDALTGLTQRPKNLIVFINPFGGKGKATSIWEKQVEPFLQLSGVAYEYVQTERAQHAHEIITNLEDDKWSTIDGFISVGGDGLFNEVLSSTLLRTQKDKEKNMNDANIDSLATPRMRFGIIGAGSANSIVASVHGLDDCPTAAIHIAIGSNCSVDVCTVHEGTDRLLRVSANAISYGWLGDTLHQSESYRFMGPIRYQWSAMLTSIRHPTYFGRVSFALSNLPVPAEGNESGVDQPQRPNLPKCLGPCHVCDGTETEPDYPFHWQTDFTHVICCVNRCISPFTPYGLAPFAEINDGSMDLALIPKVSRCENLRVMSRVALYGGRFLARSERDLNIYRCIRWKFTPRSMLVKVPENGDEAGGGGNGQPREGGAEGGNIVAAETGGNTKQPATEFEGAWNLDGEILQQPSKNSLYFRLHPNLINYFGQSNVDLDDPRYQKCGCFRTCKTGKKYSSIVYFD